MHSILNDLAAPEVGAAAATTTAVQGGLYTMVLPALG